ncbi:fluoride efflux transporter CrcB [Ethanoligenens harbinense]|uniref:Fluoride-specific ion channel FluC n=1 Tax=Ethanoligenens harbinense (strain DSM 18485 / JCM 12961 / CGMCC 1.5033 / YUAN-3) TaxID=663278 RepID=E6U3C1_ETHHY|nr:CrcB protein [Ethanoligenens harbinense YUAN-3]
MEIQRLLFVGVGSFLGGALRYAISTWTARTLGVFPVGTLIVNVAGGLLIGFIMQASMTFWPISTETRLFLTTGVMGGLTTFSTFSYESVQFFVEGKFGWMAVNVCLNLFLALFFCWLGGTIAKAVS